MEKKIRLAIIGTGIAARELHLPAIRQITDRMEIAVVCNHHREKAEAFADLVSRGGLPRPVVHSDWHKVLEMPEVDAVDIVLPVEMNLPVSREAVVAGKHVLVEKPLAEHRDNARRMVELASMAATKGKIFMVAENFRYRKAFRHMKDLIQKGNIGTPFHVEWRCWQYVSSEGNPYAATKWRQEHVYDGGFVTDAGVHYIAALRDLFGELSFRSGWKANHNPSIGRCDLLQADFDAVGGLTGRITLGFSVHSPWHDELMVMGTGGTLILDGRGVTLQRSTGGRTDCETIAFPGDDGYLGEMQDFADVISGRADQPVSTAVQAFGDLDTILSFLEHSRPR